MCFQDEKLRKSYPLPELDYRIKRLPGKPYSFCATYIRYEVKVLSFGEDLGEANPIKNP